MFRSTEHVYVPISSIECRNVDDQDAVQRIKDSIAERGLDHPIVVQEIDLKSITTQLPTNLLPSFRVVSGAKRYWALKSLETSEVPVKILPFNLTPDQCREASLHENIKRYNPPWYEQVQLEKELHELRQKMHGKASKSVPKLSSKARGWTQADTARELDIAIGQFSEDLQLANAINRNPSLKKVKDKTTALRLVKQQAKRALNEIEAFAPTSFEFNQVYLGESASVLGQLEPELFDVCITDPPWSEYQRDEELTASVESLLPVFEQVFRTLKPSALLYVITSTTDFYEYKKALAKLEFKVQSYPIFWQKPGTITHGRRPWEYARDFEPILVAAKGSPVLATTTEQSAILKFDSMHYTRMIHPHEKPIDLLKKLISDSTFPGGKVLDCFAGSGVTLEAARSLDRAYVGIERDKAFYDNIVRRLEK